MSNSTSKINLLRKGRSFSYFTYSSNDFKEIKRSPLFITFAILREVGRLLKTIWVSKSKTLPLWAISCSPFSRFFFVFLVSLFRAIIHSNSFLLKLVPSKPMVCFLHFKRSHMSNHEYVYLLFYPIDTN